MYPSQVQLNGHLYRLCCDNNITRGRFINSRPPLSPRSITGCAFWEGPDAPTNSRCTTIGQSIHYPRTPIVLQRQIVVHSAWNTHYVSFSEDSVVVQQLFNRSRQLHSCRGLFNYPTTRAPIIIGVYDSDKECNFKGPLATQTRVIKTLRSIRLGMSPPLTALPCCALIESPS